MDVGGVGEAVAGLGASIAAIGEKFQQAKDMTDMTESETSMLVQFDQLKSNYALDVDYSTMLSRWSKDADKIPDALNKNVSGRVKRARESLYLKYRRQYAVKINDSARGLQISDGRAKHAEGLDMILRTGGRFAPDRAEALIRGTAAAGYISAEEAQRDRASILPGIAYYSSYDMIEAQPKDVEGIIKLHPDLMPDMKIQLRRFAERRMAMARSAEEDALLKLQENFWQMLRVGNYDELQKMVDSSNIEITGEGGKSWWTNLIIKHAEGKVIDTPRSTRVKALEIVSDTKDGTLTRSQALSKYGSLATTEVISASDDDKYIEDIFAASELAKSAKARRDTDMFKDREKLLRDSIENTDVFGFEEATDILKDIANKAVIELNDRFRKDEYTKEELDLETDRLIRKYTLSTEAIGRAVLERELRLSETLEQQQKALTEIITSLKREGKTEESKKVLDEAITLGIFERDGTVTKGKKRSKGIIERIIEQFR